MPDQTHGEQASPKPRLTDTARGQTLFVTLWVLGTVATLGLWAGAFLWGSSQGLVGEDGTVAPPEPVAPEVTFPILGSPPATPGTQSWWELRGGECIAGFDDAFAQEFQVVGCLSSHNAELLEAQLLSDDPDEPYPGDAAVLAEAREICDLREVINREVASEYSDLRTTYSYPVNQEQWDAGERGVYCFVFSESGETFTQSLR